MDEDLSRERRTPTTDADQGHAARFRATAARVRAQAAKAAAAARPHLGPIVSTVATLAVSTLVVSTVGGSRPTGGALSPSPTCEPTGEGPSNTCRECGRPLTDGLSIQAGYGPTCARHRLT
ncbi:DUF6011 domain-containing protein [Streptomyces virginiae]|uniref:DUF6011 domain-containing protein n=1 Tax=Streptomyces virginiae TaxID=1961 RepID=UPI0036B48F1C